MDGRVGVPLQVLREILGRLSLQGVGPRVVLAPAALEGQLRERVPAAALVHRRRADIWHCSSVNKRNYSVAIC